MDENHFLTPFHRPERVDGRAAREICFCSESSCSTPISGRPHMLSSALSLGFTPAVRPPALRSVARVTPLSMLENPYDAIASPLRKWEVPPADPAAVADGANPLTDLPIEVVGLFGFIIIVGIIGLVKQSGALSEAAPTVGLGENREELTEEAKAAAEERMRIDELAQAEKEKLYFKEIASDLAGKRGGGKTKRKKGKK